MNIFGFTKKEILYSFIITFMFYYFFFLILPDSIEHIPVGISHVAIDILTFNIAALISWRLNNVLSNYFDKHYRWEEKPLTRLVSQIIICSLIVFGVVFACMIPNTILTKIFHPEILHALPDHEIIIEVIAYYFIGTIILFQSIFIGWNFYKRWITSSLEAQKLKYENVHAQLHALQNQAHPHFLFNTLNTLTSLIEEDQKIAVEFVQQLARFYRYLLQREEHHLIQLDEELRFVGSYIFLQKKRFGESLKIEIELCELCVKRTLPVFTLLILFENAIKHNIVSSENPLNIRVHCEGDFLIVENNLQKKLSTIPSNGYGLANIRNRYQILCKEDITIEQNENIFRVSLPLLTENIYNESINH